MAGGAYTTATAQPTAGGGAAGSLSVVVQAADAAARRTWRAFCREALFSPSQGPDWVDAWVPFSPHECLIAIVRRGDRPLLGTALEIVDRRRLRLARFIGDRHANGNFAALAADLDGAEAEAAAALVAGIGRARPDIDLLVLERQARTAGGRRNPLLALPHRESPNIALAASLEGGFEALLTRVGGKRKRKQHRAQTRKYQAAGGFRLVTADSPAAARSMLDAFFTMKSARLAAMGVADTFAPAHVRQAFAALFAAALDAAPPAFVLHGLEVGGKLRAVTGSSRAGERIICEFAAIAEDELADTSPGAFLFHENIRRACEEGLAVFDFSVGDEPYKRQWCDLESTQFDVLAPLTARGRRAAALHSWTGAVKRRINRSPRLWRLVKWARRRIARPAPGRTDA